MPTLGDDPTVAALDAAAAEHAAYPFGAEVGKLLERAAASHKQRTQALGRKARAALDAVEKALAIEAELAELDARRAALLHGGKD